MDNEKSLIIWLVDGKTMKFEKVSHLSNDDLHLTFNYFGVSTQVPRKAVFNKKNIAGFAIEV